MSRRLTGVELLDEEQWLLEGCVHPLLICQTLRKTPGSIVAAARWHKRPELYRVFATVDSFERKCRKQVAA